MILMSTAGCVYHRYDLTMASWTHDQEVLDQLVHKASLPDVILVRKVSGML
jgi:hypothetical protein